MKKSAIAACVLMFGASFLIVAIAYDSLPTQLPMVRNPLAGAVSIAPKSPFTAFRVCSFAESFARTDGGGHALALLGL